jgi:acyl-coenzyme A synthetase/AMP-(fatty) acid ligase
VTSAESLASLLLEHPFPDDQPLLHGPAGSLTAGSARAASRAFAGRLRDAGVEPGQAVALQMPDGPALVTAMFGVWIAGAVFVPVNRRAPEPEVAKVLAATGAVALVTGDSASIAPLAPSAGEARTYEPDTAFVMWTSGTTGEPKPILHQHSAYFELIDRVLGPLRGTPSSSEVRSPTPNLIAVSLALNAGIYNVLFGLRAGAAIVIMDGFSAPGFAEVVREFGIRSTVLPPAAITMLAADDSVTDLGPLRYVRSITAPLAPLQARRFTDKFGVTVLNGYGQAEIGEVIGWTAADAREHPGKVGAAGRPHPGVAIKVVSDTGEVVADADVAGRLLVKPPRMAAGYATGGELADRVDAEGFLDTGDLARVDAEGFVWIEGRGGDVINRGGNKVFPDHVADALRLVPGVIDAGVVGVPDERLGAVPIAFVVTDRAVTDDELRATCREHLAPYKVPVAFHRVDELPRTEVGKLRRSELAELHATLTGASS